MTVLVKHAWVWEHARVNASIGASALATLWDSVEAAVNASVWDSIWDSVGACYHAPWLAFSRFFDVYLAPNELHALAQFNELVSGYWLGQEVALLVRRPQLLSRDAHGHLHSASGTCMEYPDGWGFYAWHGVRVPAQVILAPDQLTGADWRAADNVEVRRVLQERMGSRFVRELQGKRIDADPRGILYEVDLRDDPERVARSVQVQDASTPRQYVLRVPPIIQTAAEAVAWSFRLSVETCQPGKET